ncbi:MAG: glutamine synthetase family protein [Oscillospiraceae bacterium]|nr:glutamine synthetase family protein [Oscillospiraceae bacterium]
MNTTIKEVLSFAEENDVKFIRLSFCDMFGVHKNISIMSDELESAFKNGIPFDANAISDFCDITRSDLLLFPDPGTPEILPWRPGSGRVLRFYCDIKNPDGSPFCNDSRWILKQVIRRAEEKGYICKIGAEFEFYLFKTDENGEPTDITVDKGGYLDIPPLDKCEDIRREICLTLEEMGIKPESSHHERGPGQNEIDFRFGDALTCADNFQAFKSVVMAIAARNGLYASFLPKPIANTAGNGMHVNLSLSLKNSGRNIFKNIGETEDGVVSASGDGHSEAVGSFIAGILEKVPEMTMFLNPIINSYERLGEFEAPKYVSWSHRNRSQLIRIPAAVEERARMELRSPDPSVNPYIAFALIIAAGLDGIERGLKLPPPVDADLYTAKESVTDSLALLPKDLEEAVNFGEKSEFIKSVIGEEFHEKYVAAKRKEVAQWKTR